MKVAKLLVVGLVICSFLAAIAVGSASAQPGGTIVFAGDRDGPKTQIYTISADGTGLSQVIADRFGYIKCSRPSWSPDGELIAFDAGPAHRCDIWLVKPDGTDLVNVTNNQMNALEPDSSPDGTQVAFNTPYTLYVINVDGSGLASLGPGVHPKWSPDGGKVLFSNWGITYDSDLFVLDLASGTVTQLTNTPGIAEVFGDWSPDGSQIACSATDGSGGDIWLMNADGSGRVNLTAPWSGYAEYGSPPAWSPDGNYIAFASNYAGNSDIWTMEADGANPVNITNTDWNEYHPSWWGTAAPLLVHEQILMLEGTINDQHIDASQALVQVEPGEAISGSFGIRAQNTSSNPGAIYPVAATPNWGEPSSSYWGVASHAHIGWTTWTVNVDLLAPTEPGTYYIAVALAGRYNYAQVMSCTHAGTSAAWNDGNDIADWSASQFEHAFEYGWAAGNTLHPDGTYHRYAYGATAVRVEVVEMGIEAQVDIDPDTLRLQPRGRPITAYIELPEGYDAAEIDVELIRLYFEGAPEAGIPVFSRYRPHIGDDDDDGVPDLMVKFDRRLVASYLEPGEVEMTVTGDLSDGTPFQGSDTVRVIRPGRR